MIRFSVLVMIVLATWMTVLLPSQGRAENTLGLQLQQAFQRGELQGLHAVLVLLDGEIFAEAYFPGEDENWGRRLGRREFNAQSLHDLRSVTKSITGLLYGIAHDQGLVPPVEASLLAQFPEYPDLAADKSRATITIGDALSMKMGTDWNESLPYSDPANSEVAMEMSADRYRFVLDRPMVTKPGTIWNYNGGATAVIARLISQGTGQSLETFAKTHLFAPLGIENYEWAKGRDGEVSAASGLRLTARDLAKIGQMIANGGEFDGHQIVSAHWLEQSFTPWADKLDGPFNYGYFWWLAPGQPPAFVAGFGNGGQRLSINRDKDLIFVVFAGNYNQRDAWKVPVKISSEFLGPALDAHLNE